MPLDSLFCELLSPRMFWGGCNVLANLIALAQEMRGSTNDFMTKKKNKKRGVGRESQTPYPLYINRKIFRSCGVVHMGKLTVEAILKCLLQFEFIVYLLKRKKKKVNLVSKTFLWETFNCLPEEKHGNSLLPFLKGKWKSMSVWYDFRSWVIFINNTILYLAGNL